MLRAVLMLIAAMLSLLTAPEPVFAVEDCVWAARLSEEGIALLNDHPSRAVNKLKDAISYCGLSASLYYNLGLAYYKQNKFAEARDQMERAMRLRPGYAKAANDLAYIYAAHLNDKQRAWILARVAVRSDPKNNDFLETFALTKELDIEDPPKLDTRRPDAVAIVIGNRNYKSSSIPAVEFAHRDASLVKRYLDEACGFRGGDIIDISDANVSQMNKVFGDKDDHRGILYDRIEPAKSDVVIYYTGHGAYDPVARESYLLPMSADTAALGETAYPLSMLYENLAKINKEKRPRSVVLILDASFNSSVPGGAIIPEADPVAVLTNAPLAAMKNVAAFISARSDQESSVYAEKGHGLFTYLFVRSLRELIEMNSNGSVADLEAILLGFDGVSDTAKRLYNRDQVPQIVGNKTITLMP
ncbi:MAG: caspase family protein [Nitrospirota bacterium]|nr:caspase family protein [Nitrospirota bacterium]